MRAVFMPDAVGRLEKPKPGSEPMITSNEPCAVGLASRRPSFNISRNDPGQPCSRRIGVGESPFSAHAYEVNGIVPGVVYPGNARATQLLDQCLPVEMLAPVLADTL